MCLGLPCQQHAFPYYSWKLVTGQTGRQNLKAPCTSKSMPLKVLATICSFTDLSSTRVTNGNPNQAVPLVEFTPLVFTCRPGESYQRRLRSLLCLCDFFWALINSLACWSSTSALGLASFCFRFMLKRCWRKKKEEEEGNSFHMTHPNDDTFSCEVQ